MSEERPVSTRRALFGHLWAMVQTRAAAAALVVRLQRTALVQGAVMYGIAAVAALSFFTAVIVLIAVAAPPEWRALALGGVAAALLATAILGVVAGGRKLRRDVGLIEDFTRGLKLDLAMLSLAMKGSNPQDEEKLAERERAKTAVREAAVAKAAAPSTAEGGSAAPEGPSMSTASAAMRAASPGDSAATAAGATSAAELAAAARNVEGDDAAARTAATGGAYAVPAASGAGQLPPGVTERERPEPPVTTPESPPADREQKYGSA